MLREKPPSKRCRMRSSLEGFMEHKPGKSETTFWSSFTAGILPSKLSYVEP